MKEEGNARAAGVFLGMGTLLLGVVTAIAGAFVWFWMSVVVQQFPELAATSFGDGYRLGAHVAGLESEVVAMKAEREMLEVQLKDAMLPNEEQRLQLQQRLRDGTF